MRRRWCLRLAPLVALFGVAATPALALAQWEIVTGSPLGAGGEVQIARVSNNDGDQLSVFLDADSMLRAQFEISDRLTTLDTSTCPTYLVDGGTPRVVRFGEERCMVAGSIAIFALGAVNGDAIASGTLLELMNGTSLTLRYHLGGIGYRETRFSLRGSKQALNAAIGEQVQVVDDVDQVDE